MVKKKVRAKIDAPKKKEMDSERELDTLKKQLAELKEFKELYQDLVEKAEIGILLDDVEGNLIYCNNKFSSMFGYTKEERKTTAPFILRWMWYR